jgi:predicted negative regulator of RcsB-dependent stress response
VDEPDNESDFLFEFWAWLEANRLSAIIVIGVALIGGFYLYVSQFKATQLVGEAGSTLEATNMVAAQMVAAQLGSVPPESYESVMREYPDTSAGERAWLIWARGLLDAGKVEEAQTQFEGFLAKHGKSPMASAAELGKALCLDERDDRDAAKAGYEGVIEKYPGELVAQYAMLNLAALHEVEGRPKEARDLLQNLIEGDLTFFERNSPMRFMGSQRVTSNLARKSLSALFEKNPQWREEVQNPHVPPTSPVGPEGNATALPENNGTKNLPIENNATPPKPADKKIVPKGKPTPKQPEKSGR